MIKRLCSFIIISIFCATSVVNAVEIYNKNGNKLRIYGGIDQKYNIPYNDKSVIKKSTQDTGMYILGLLGETKLNNQLTGYSRLEYKGKDFLSDINDNNNNDDKISLGLIGLKFGHWNSIDYGRKYSVMCDAKALTNRHAFIKTHDVFRKNDIFLIDRSSNVITYHNYNLFGLSENVTAVLQYQEDYNNKLITGHGKGWGSSLKYHNKYGITAIASWLFENRTILQISDGQGSNAHAYGVGLKYEDDNMYMAAFYGQGHNITAYKNDANFAYRSGDVELFGEYDFNCGISSSVSYSESYGKSIKNIDTPMFQNISVFNKQINFSGHYNFNKKMYTYIDYKLDLLQDDEQTKTHTLHDNILSTGMVYKF